MSRPFRFKCRSTQLDAPSALRAAHKLLIILYILDSIDYRKAVSGYGRKKYNDFPQTSIVANCPGSGGTGAGLLGSHCAQPSGDIGAGNMCLDASTVSEELHVAP